MPTKSADELKAYFADGLVPAQPQYVDLIDSIGNGGWMTDASTWSYASVSSFTVSGDQTSKFHPGTKIKILQSTFKYFEVSTSTVADGITTVNLYGGSGYSLTNTAMPERYYSYHQRPYGFPDWYQVMAHLNGAAHLMVDAESYLSSMAYNVIWRGTSMVGGSAVGTDIRGDNHLTRNGSNGAAPRTGSIGKALLPIISFDGSSGYVSRANANQLQANGGNYFAFGGWWWIDSINRYHGLMRWGATTPNLGLYINNTNGVEVRWWNTAGSANTYGVSANVATGWNFIAGSFLWNNATSQAITIYYNGTNYYDGTNRSTTTIRGASGDFRIGYDGSYYLHGGYSVAFCGDSTSFSDIIAQYYQLTRRIYQ